LRIGIGLHDNDPFKLMKSFFAGAILLLIAGCASQPAALNDNHPANPKAPPSSEARAVAVLTRGQPPSTTSTNAADSGQEDHEHNHKH
jgi:hypothetical protein